MMWHLYCLRSPDTLPLYVGITENIEKRRAEHLAAGTVRTDQFVIDLVASYPTKEEAHQAEIQLIQAEHPAYNVQHSTPRGRRIRWALRVLDSYEEARAGAIAVATHRLQQAHRDEFDAMVAEELNEQGWAA